jgi:hypothetical protein
MTAIQPLRADRTDAIATRVPSEDREARQPRQSRWPIWRVAVPVLTLLFVLYPAVMIIPRHGPMPASIAATEPVPIQGGVRESCPPIDLCAAVAVEQALPRLPIPPLLLLSLAVIVLAMHRRYRAPARHRDWWWPPNRRRALLQVFLI